MKSSKKGLSMERFIALISNLIAQLPKLLFSVNDWDFAFNANNFSVLIEVLYFPKILSHLNPKCSRKLEHSSLVIKI